MVGERLPDFFVVGAMKGGSTTVFRRLSTHPDTSLPQSKEPNFFVAANPSAEQWRSYRQLFAVGHGVTGEASVAYSNPEVSADVAGRMACAVPNAKIIFVARDPVQRLRSHYLHEVLRGREARPLLACLTDHDSTYVARSMYTRCLGPYLAEFDRDQVLVLQSERLDEPDEWERLEHFLSLSHHPNPTERHYVSSQRSRETALMRWARDRGLQSLEQRTPAVLRRLARPLLIRDDARTRRAREEARRAPIPAQIRSVLRADAEAFAALVGWRCVPWQI